MPEPKLPTKFMPAEKAAPEAVKLHHSMFLASPVVYDTLNGMLNFSFILNSQRQTVFVNKAFSDFLDEHGVENKIGQRFGQLAGCSHAEEPPGGCGTTDACTRCGTAMATAAALEGGEDARECRILSKKSGDELDLRVQVKPFSYNGEEFLLLSLLDISADKRRQVLEKIFFHDILNTAGGVQGLISLMVDSSAEETQTYVPAAARASDFVIEQILSQRDLAAAERGDLQIKTSSVAAVELLKEVAELFRAHEAGKDMQVVVSGDCGDLKINTDRTLLARIIGNLVKNALEAEKAGATITLACRKLGSAVTFTVHNPGQMHEDSRLQIFQRSFSTKGEGRGLGTYSIRLLTEKYLKGKVSFTTDPSGTEFRVELPGAL